MYRQIRRVLEAKSAIKVAMGTGEQKRDILKSDERIDNIRISDCCELYVVVQKEPDTFKVTINFPGSIGRKEIHIAEV